MRRETIHLILNLFLLLTVFAAGCTNQGEFALSGQTMGTGYEVKFIAPAQFSAQSLQQQVEQRLTEINQSMSTYDPFSEISRFNQISDTTQYFPVSDDFRYVLTVSQEIHRLSQGAWDPTLDPLINLWGFGGRSHGQQVPDSIQIASALEKIGLQHLEITGRGLRKKIPGLSLDLGSIAKGYGVDQVSMVLRKSGLANFLVEIGGEVVAVGCKRNGQPWRVGINYPDKEATLFEIYTAVPLSDRAIATSGNYRNFFEMDGQMYSHLIDPRTGYPISNQVVSVSVIAPNCTLADGLATALMLLDVEHSLDLIRQLDGVECLIVTRLENNRFDDHYSQGFPRAGD